MQWDPPPPPPRVRGPRVTLPAWPPRVGEDALALVALPDRGSINRRLQEFDAAVEDLLKALDMTTEGDMVQQAQRQLLLAYNDFAVHCYMQGAYQERVLLLNKALKDEQQEKSLYINSGGEWGSGGARAGPLPKP